jgi:hypothetical protein
MTNSFNDMVYREVLPNYEDSRSNVVKSGGAKVIGKTKITVDEENHEGVKIIVKKDANENVREIKFVCSCGQTKSIILDYTEQ